MLGISSYLVGICILVTFFGPNEVAGQDNNTFVTLSKAKLLFIPIPISVNKPVPVYYPVKRKNYHPPPPPPMPQRAPEVHYYQSEQPKPEPKPMVEPIFFPMFGHQNHGAAASMHNPFLAAAGGHDYRSAASAAGTYSTSDAQQQQPQHRQSGNVPGEEYESSTPEYDHIRQEGSMYNSAPMYQDDNHNNNHNNHNHDNNNIVNNAYSYAASNPFPSTMNFEGVSRNRRYVAIPFPTYQTPQVQAAATNYYNPYANYASYYYPNYYSNMLPSNNMLQQSPSTNLLSNNFLSNYQAPYYNSMMRAASELISAIADPNEGGAAVKSQEPHPLDLAKISNLKEVKQQEPSASPEHRTPYENPFETGVERPEVRERLQHAAATSSSSSSSTK